MDTLRLRALLRDLVNTGDPGAVWVTGGRCVADGMVFDLSLLPEFAQNRPLSHLRRLRQETAGRLHALEDKSAPTETELEEYRALALAYTDCRRQVEALEEHLFRAGAAVYRAGDAEAMDLFAKGELESAVRALDAHAGEDPARRMAAHAAAACVLRVLQDIGDPEGRFGAECERRCELVLALGEAHRACPEALAAVAPLTSAETGRRCLLAAMELWEQAPERYGPHLAWCQFEAAKLLNSVWDDAYWEERELGEQYLRAAIAVYQRRPEQHWLRLALGHLLLGYILYAWDGPEDRSKEAEAQYLAAVSLLEKANQPEVTRLYLAQTYGLLIDLCRETGASPERRCLAALPLWEQLAQEDPWAHWSALKYYCCDRLAWLYAAQGDQEKAEQYQALSAGLQRRMEG